jgi:hypothetical protein
VDNIRLSTERVWPKLTTFKVLGTNLSVSGVEELGAKLNGDWKKPEPGSADELEAEFRAKLDELKKAHPAAVLAIFREGQAGFEAKNPAKAFSGWADTHVNAHSPDGPNEGRTQVSGGYDRIEAFMRHRSALMRIDLSSILAGSEILAARLVIQGEGTGSFSGPPEKVPVPVPPGDTHRFPEDGKTEPVPNMWAAEACNRPWVEGEANGYEYAKGKYWRQTGGMDWDGETCDFLPLFVAHGPSQGPTSWWDFTEAVRFWTAGSHPNHGFMLHGTGSPYMHMFTKEHKDPKLRPALYVIYEPK